MMCFILFNSNEGNPTDMIVVYYMWVKDTLQLMDSNSHLENIYIYIYIYCVCVKHIQYFSIYEEKDPFKDHKIIKNTIFLLHENKRY